MTVDVERFDQSFDKVSEDVVPVLDTLRQYCSATFFVTGEVAYNNPDLVKEITDAGHEVACHGLFHERFYKLGFAEQIRRITIATENLTNACGKRPLGFRAPQHTANAETICALEKLEYVYDSSVLPQTPFMRPHAYEKRQFLFAPKFPYFPSRFNIVKQGDCRVLELPVSTCIVPFMSNLSMRSNTLSDIVASMIARHAQSRNVPIVYYLHSYDSRRGRKMEWLERVINTLRMHGAKFVTMHDASNSYTRAQ